MSLSPSFLSSVPRLRQSFYDRAWSVSGELRPHSIATIEEIRDQDSPAHCIAKTEFSASPEDPIEVLEDDRNNIQP